MLTTTLNRIREHQQCQEGWEKLLKYLGKTKADDEVLPYSVIVESNGIDDALWCCRAEPKYRKQWRLYGVWCAKQVTHLMNDKRSLKALEVAEKHAYGKATDEELAAAWGAAVYAARDAAGDAARAAAKAARAAAGYAAGDSARSAGDSARVAAGDAARAAAGDAAWVAAREAQKEMFLKVVQTTKGGGATE